MHLNPDLTLDLATQRRSELLRYAAESRMARAGRTERTAFDRIRSVRRLLGA